MAEFRKSGDTSSQDQIVILRAVLQRIAQAEHPIDFVIMEQLLLERIREPDEGYSLEPIGVNA